jgi:hypothetical protein
MCTGLFLAVHWAVFLAVGFDGGGGGVACMHAGAAGATRFFRAPYMFVSSYMTCCAMLCHAVQAPALPGEGSGGHPQQVHPEPGVL